MRAIIDFSCMGMIAMKLSSSILCSSKEDKGIIKCPTCHSQYEFTDNEFIGKLEKLRKLLLAVQDAGRNSW